jgi:hypothetical protein
MLAFALPLRAVVAAKQQLSVPKLPFVAGKVAAMFFHSQAWPRCHGR